MSQTHRVSHDQAAEFTYLSCCMPTFLTHSAAPVNADDLNSTTSKRVRLGIEARELLKEVMKLQGKLNMLDAQLLLDAGLANAELEHGEPSRETVKGRAPVAGTGWGRGRGSMVPGYLSPHLERLVSGEAAHSQSSAPHW